MNISRVVTGITLSFLTFHTACTKRQTIDQTVFSQVKKKQIPKQRIEGFVVGASVGSRVLWSHKDRRVSGE